LGAIGGVVGNADKHVLRKMSDILCHRGNNIEVNSDSKACFFSRSSSNDLWSGCLSEGSHMVAYTGEMYQKDLAGADAARRIMQCLVSPDRIEVTDPGVLLNGVFAFALYDSKKGRLALARDYAGYCPLYYYRLDDRILFASEVKSILAGLDVPPKLDREVLARYLQYGHCPGLRTLFKGIRRVPPSSILLFDLERHSTSLYPYGTINYTPMTGFHEKELCRRIYETLRDTVVLQTRLGESPYGVFLSGGLDSSFLAAVLSQVEHKNVVAFTSVYSEEELNQSSAKTVAEALGIEHNPILVKHEDIIPIARKVAYIFDDLVGNPNTLVPGFLLTQEASKRVRAVFTADGADMLFHGWFDGAQRVRTIEKLEKVPTCVKTSSSTILKQIIMFQKVHFRHTDRMRRFSYLRGEYWDELLESSLLRETAGTLESALAGVSTRYFRAEEIPILLGEKMENLDRSMWNEIQTYFHVPDTAYMNQVYYSFESMMHTDDNGPSFNEKLSGYFGLTSRLPMRTDFKLLQFAANIPMHLKQPRIKPTETKYIWRRAAAMYTKIPRTVIKSSHHGMSLNPVTKWLLSDLRDEAEGLAFGCMDELHLNKRYIAETLRKGRGYQIRILLMLSLWYEHYRKMLSPS
jgi:asparagine synthase (glutamine-hydrolysing)